MTIVAGYDLAALRAPFKPEDIEWRVSQESKDGSKVMVLAYITARAAQTRLDEVIGPLNWQVDYSPGPSGGVKATISILDPSGGWVSKSDGAENTDIEAIKGGVSGAFKRACVVWGIGRYLYELGDTWVPTGERGDYYHKSKALNRGVRWNAPALPKWALPAGAKAKLMPKAEQDVQHFDPETHAAPSHQPLPPVKPPVNDKAVNMVAAFKRLGVTDAMLREFLGDADPYQVDDFSLQLLRDIHNDMTKKNMTWEHASRGVPLDAKEESK